ncbi:peptidoglycan glycosyltransferase FtsI [Gilliamella sp. Fer1-1]|jgi:cell division protein FtsI (penicillin-binding protein 3)|uniref:peptidoglycan glycosyltransferase FtsI n=1 Tax=unclassified Gilliamella TaxID=2685620 RepID=UPI00080ECAD2|nr:peptidoglycan glycosyltransferase FtsI [Gilliamella apicola]OCG18098.1 peptidoglycan glycosyltransferase FtsI [Gilliamella apicola]OCG29590.1 peptidoglycan glycosyltransferase FtsI [Gilliamella apicola]OCG29783.1 peptidoglycan glycosyltransferase FtsI [Gilliamella apicola]OCG39265.1 peptidoglycan glycosyltransferase FtsI [Gilliamella apicola]OCG44598.1 peptidoglycan glycosyltransferase FtsI [Gilliamella apicola]
MKPVTKHKKDKTKKATKTNKLNSKKQFFTPSRFYIVYTLIIFAIISLIVRMALLQIIEPDKLIAEGNKRSIRHQEMDAPRAMITDRHGRALAVSVPMFDVWADPKIVVQKGGVKADDIRWQGLAKTLNIPMSTLEQKLGNASMRFVYLSRQVTPTISDYLKKLKLPGISFAKTSKRYYPAAENIAQLIGLTDIDENGAEKGSEGIEKSFNKWLIGESGQRIVRRDRVGRVIEELERTESETAADLTLSIDERLQSLVYTELSQAVEFNKADSGTAVLVDVHTGEILAMATSPSYNPNNRSSLDYNLLRNRAVTDAFEPGSTVKPLVVMAALEKKIANLNTIIDTRPFYVNRYEIKDVSYQKSLNLAGILEKSSNVGVSKLALQMQQGDLVEFYSRFGLGQPTELGLGGEVSGSIAADRTRKWADIERATFAFGYGLRVTPLQLARAYATIGSYGIYRPVTILKATEPVKGKRVVSEKDAKTVVQLMEAVAVTGGGTKASVPGYSVAVKTGTAKKLSGGRYVNQYLAYTAGIAPATGPKYSLVVVIDNPKAGQYYGGSVSAPVFSRIMGGVLRTMNVKPDRQIDGQMIIY